MTPEQIARDVLELAERATPGEWRAWVSHSESFSSSCGAVHWAHSCGPALMAVARDDKAGLQAQSDQAMHDAKFISSTRTSAPTLARAFLDQSEQLREARELLEMYAALADKIGDKVADDKPWCGQDGIVITYGALRSARAFLACKGE